MNELNGEIRTGNKLAQDYKSLESDYVKMKREFDRLNKRAKLDESSNEGESIINKVHQELPRNRIADDYKHREQAGKYYDNDVPQVRQRESLENENARLREELALAYDTIQELKDKLERAESELTRWEREAGSRRGPDRKDTDRLNESLRKAENKILSLEEALRQGGNAKGQLATLKQQNE